MNVTEGKSFSNQAAGTLGPFTLGGSRYGIVAHATSWGSLQLQTLASDEATWVNVGSAITADGYATDDLIPGQYQFVGTGGSGYYVAIVRVPF